MPRERVNVRLTPIQQQWLRKLAEIYQLDHSNVLRLALTRFAQDEGIAPGGKGWMRETEKDLQA